MRFKKAVQMSLGQGRNKDADLENGLEDTRGRGSWDEVREQH